MVRQSNKPFRAKESTTKLTQPSSMEIVPWDIIESSILPYLTWHTTSAFGCTSHIWSQSVRDARSRHCECKTSYQCGSNIDNLISQLIFETVQLRFPPSLIIINLSWNIELEKAGGGIWTSLITSMEKAQLIPIKCQVIGIGAECATTVSISLTMAHFPKSDLEIVSFDREQLRWSASGLGDTTICPFDTSSSSHSLLLLSSNYASAHVLLDLTSRWFPTSPIVGGVTSSRLNAPLLMKYTRGLLHTTGLTQKQQKKLHRQRKRAGVQRHHCPGMTFPHSMVLQCKGSVRWYPFSQNSDRIISPIFQCKEIRLNDRDISIGSVITSLSLVNWLKRWLLEEENTSRHGAEYRQTGTLRLTVYVASHPDAFKSMLQHQEDRDKRLFTIRRISISLVYDSVLDIDGWESGEYGVLAVVESSQESIHVSNVANAFGGLVMSCHKGQGYKTIGGLKLPVSYMSHQIGPLAYPTPHMNGPSQVQTHIESGLLYSVNLAV